jgi:multiple sugar transport system ATP-binding protein
MAEVNLTQVKKSFGVIDVIKGVDLNIPDGDFCVFVGPSGCGKSTLLRMIAGLEDTTAGSIQIGKKEMVNVDPANRGVAMVFQSYALYPHMTVAENITFGMRMAKRPKAEMDEKLAKASKMLKLDQMLTRKPSQLSGGQRQRVAIGRAIVRQPDVFLFDEPLSNLDASLRVEMRTEIAKLHHDLGATMIYVTHDQVEAMTMADMIVVLNAGRIEQVGSPLELYHRPKTLFVARFMGSPQMNVFECGLSDAGANKVTCTLPGGSTMVLDVPAGAAKPAKATFGTRPEHMEIADKGDLGGTVVLAEKLGSETMVYVDIGASANVIVKAGGLTMLKPGEKVAIKLNPAACHLFTPEGALIRNGSLL